MNQENQANIPNGPPPLPFPSREKSSGPTPTTEAVAIAKTDKPKKPVHEYKDGHREFIETVVFVVILVLLLKTFDAEAFIIPTGSMATTLLGYHKEIQCEKCRYTFPVNASDAVESSPPYYLEYCFCPNCLFRNEVPLPAILREVLGPEHDRFDNLQPPFPVVPEGDQK